MDTALVLIAVIYLAINIYPTIKTFRIAELKKLHRLYKISVIWLIPIVGGLIISLIYLINPAYGRGPYDVGSGYHSNDGSDHGGD